MSDTHTTAVICSTSLLKICCGNADFASKMLEKFKVLASNHGKEIHSAFENGDLEAVRTRSHTLKGSSSTMAAMPISKLAASIEDDVKNGDTTGTAGKIKELNSLIEEALEFSL